jgi:hypothetical protein
MVLNLRSHTITTSRPENESFTCSVIVDDKRIDKVWFVDLGAGLIKTYDIMGDGKSFSYRDVETSKLPTDLEVVDGIISRTIRGRVEITMRSVA